MNYFKKRIQSFLYAFKGLFDLLSGRHPNALIHLLAIFVVTILGMYYQLSNIEWCVIILCFGLVLALEAINSALEYLVDLASPNYHPLAGKAKDIAATAVLITAISSVCIAILIFLPKFC